MRRREFLKLSLGTVALTTLSPDPDSPEATHEAAFGRLDDALAFLRGGMAALRRHRRD